MKILGVELGTWSVKAVEMDTRFRRTEILDLHEVQLPLEKVNYIEAYKAAIDQILKRLPITPEKIVTSLPASSTALRFFQVPVKNLKKVEQMYRFELEDSIPFKLEDCITEHYSVRTKEGSLVFAAVAPKKHIQSFLEWLYQIHLEPDWLTFEGMGVINLFLSSKENKDIASPVLLLDIGHSKTNISIINNSQLLFFRSVSWGGAAITSSIGVSFNLGPTQADKKKIDQLNLEAKPTTGPEKDLLICGEQALSTLMTEINHSLVSFKNQYKEDIQTILLTGGTSQIRGLVPFMEKNLGKPTNLFKPFQGLTIEIKEEVKQTKDLRFGEALGRSIVFARNSTLLFNFRKDELAKSTSLDEVGEFLKNPQIVKGLKYTGILSAIFFIYALIATPLARIESQSAQDEVKKVLQDTFQSIPSKLKSSLSQDPKGLRKFIQNKNFEIEKKLKALSSNRATTLKMIKMISDSFSTTSKVDVNTLSIDDSNILIEGVLYSGELNTTTETLKKLPFIKEIKLDLNGQRFAYRGSVIK
jgi:type IV pilus assembly protein PilM